MFSSRFLDFFFPLLCHRCALLPFSDMEELLKHLTEVSIRQQQIVEHLATRQGRTEQELAALHATAAPCVPQPDARAQARGGHRTGGCGPTTGRWVGQERRAPEGIPRRQSRPAVPSPRDEPMPKEPPTPPTRTWLAGCIVHHDLPAGPLKRR